MHLQNKDLMLFANTCFLIIHSDYVICSHFSLSGLQMADVELDERVTALEENGGGIAQNGTLMNCKMSQSKITDLDSI